MLRFILPIDKDKKDLCSLALDVIGATSRKYPEREQLTMALTELYNASIRTTVSNFGDHCVFGVCLECLCDKYTLNGETVSDKAVDILIGCLFDPYIENGGFSPKYFELSKNEMLDDYAAIINNKRRYAYVMSLKQIFENELVGITPFDRLDIVKNADPVSAYEAYKELIRTAYIDMSITGGEVPESVKNKLIDAIMSVERDPYEPKSFISPSPVKEEVRYSETSAVTKQCQLIMAYKNKESNEYSLKLFICMLGSTPTSKLFLNVREKLSLCYYCDASLVTMKNTVIITSGLDKDKLEQAKAAIADQIKAMQDGDFTDEELANAKKHLVDVYLSNYDSKFDMFSWYFYQRLRGSTDSPEEKAKKIMSLTREDIIKEARGYKLDTVFVLQPENGGDMDEA